MYAVSFPLNPTTILISNHSQYTAPVFNFYVSGKDHLRDSSKVTIVDTPGYLERGTPEWSEMFSAYVKNRPKFVHIACEPVHLSLTNYSTCFSLKLIFILFRGEDQLSTHDLLMLRNLESLCKDSTNGVRFQPIFSKCDQVGPRDMLRRMLDNVNRIYQTTPSAVEPWIMTSTRGKGLKMGIDAMREAIVVGAGVSRRVAPQHPPGPGTIFQQLVLLLGGIIG